MKQITLADGQSVPSLGLGTWRMFEGSAQSAVKNAIQIGYRHIDCAWIYLNESDIGRAFSQCFDSKVVHRDELFITSKLWNDRHRPELVMGALKETLAALQLEFLDMYLIHWPIAHKPGVVRPENGTDFETLDAVPLSETWSAIVECQAAGLCRNIGVSNFSQSKIEDLVAKTGIRPSYLQVESHPYLQQKELFSYCRSNSMAFVAYSPLGSGDRPANLKSENEPSLFEDQTLQDMAAHRNITTGQLMLAWAVSRGSAAIPKSASPERQMENLAAASIELDESEKDVISNLDRQHRFVDGSFWELENGPYTATGIWQ